MTVSQPNAQTRLKAFSLALKGRNISILHQNRDDTFDLAESLPSPWNAESIIGQSGTTFMPEPAAAIFGEAYGLCRTNKLPQRFEFELPDSTARRTFQAQMSLDEDGVTTILTDITEEREREAAMVSLLREVSHRSKNLLAIVQSVAMQTAQHSGGIDDFLEKFRGRLHALSSTQDLVTESNWRGTYLQSLVTSQLSRVGGDVLGNLRLTGENPLLGPNASLHIGLAMHELGANAALHGGFTRNSSGNIWVDARFDIMEGTEPQLVIEWQETGVTRQGGNRERRFGTLVLERIVPLSVGGKAEFSIADDSVRYLLSVPASQFEH